MALEATQLASTCCLPQAGSPVVTCGHYEAPVRGEDSGSDPVGVPLEATQLASTRCLPHEGGGVGSVVACGKDESAVGGEDSGVDMRMTMTKLNNQLHCARVTA
jgi:hypothetical protein